MPIALAEQPTFDLTTRCEFLVSSNSGDIRYIVDDDPSTIWVSTDEHESYLEIKMPAAQATLSILWDGLVPTLTVEILTDGGWEIITVMENPNPMPKTLLVGNPAQRVRLRSDGTMRIAELRVTEGITGSYFEDHTFQGREVKTATRFIGTPPPLSLGMSGKPVETLQKRLSELGYTESSDDPTFSQETHRALTMFQRANHLPETGTLDYETEQVLFGFTPIAATPRPYTPTGRLPRTASALVHFSQDQVGKGYIYGSSGVIGSRYLREQNAKLYPSYSRALLELASKWDGIEVFDCIGLFKAFLSRSDGPFPKEWNTNVTGATKRWFTEMDTINTMPREPGILLLRRDPDTRSFSHIGIYVGNGRCVHSRGHVYGVVEEPMPNLWTHWARPSWLEFDLPAEEATPWRPYLGIGDVAMIDTSYDGALGLLDGPPSVGGKTFGVRVPNKTYVLVDGIPLHATDILFRRVVYTNEEGRTFTGYVNAKHLSYVPNPSLAMDLINNPNY